MTWWWPDASSRHPPDPPTPPTFWNRLLWYRRSLLWAAEPWRASTSQFRVRLSPWTRRAKLSSCLQILFTSSRLINPSISLDRLVGTWWTEHLFLNLTFCQFKRKKKLIPYVLSTLALRSLFVPQVNCSEILKPVMDTHFLVRSIVFHF